MDKQLDETRPKGKVALPPLPSLSNRRKSSASSIKHKTPRKITDDLSTSRSAAPRDKHEMYLEAFERMDLSHNGQITKEEFKKILDDLSFGNNWTHEKMDSLFHMIDEDDSGAISEDNFLEALEKKPVDRDLATLVREILHDRPVSGVFDDYREDEEARNERKRRLKEETRARRIEEYNKMGPEAYALEILDIDKTHYKRYYKAFSLIDMDESGNINKGELVFLLDMFSLGIHLSRQELDELFAELDKGEDGEISFMDFLESLNGENPNKALLGIISNIHGKYKEIKQFKVEQTEKKKRGEYEVSDLKMQESDFKRYNKIFDEMDVNLNGVVSREEFMNVLRLYCQDISLSEEQINEIFDKIDENHDGSISLYEFLKSIEKGDCEVFVSHIKKISERDDHTDPVAYAKYVLHIPEYQIKKYQKAFDLIDLNGNGSISKNEFDDVVRAFSLLKNVTPQYIGAFYNTIDIDKSGEINLLDFLRSLGGERQLKKLTQIVDTIVGKEKELVTYAKQKGIKRQKAVSMPNMKKTSFDKAEGNVEESFKRNEAGEKESLLREIEGLKKIIAAKEEGQRTKDQMILEKEIENKKLLKRNQELEGMMKMKERGGEDIALKASEFEKEKEKLRLGLNKAQSEIEALKLTNSDSLQEVLKLNQALSKMVSREEFEQLLKENNANKENIIAAQLSLKLSENDKKNLEVVNSQMKERIDQLKRQNEEIGAEILRESKVIEDSNSKMSQNSQETEILRNMMEKVKAEKSLVETENNWLKEKLEQFEKQYRLTSQSQEEMTLSTIATSDKSDSGWVERSRDVETLTREVQKPQKVKAFVVPRNSQHEDVFLKPEELQALLERSKKDFTTKREEIYGSGVIADANEEAGWQTRGIESKLSFKVSCSGELKGNSAKQAKVPQLRNEVLAENVPSQRIDQEGSVEQFLKTIGCERVIDPVIKDELVACVREISDEDLGKWLRLSRFERVNFISLVVSQVKEQAKLKNVIIKVDHLERLLEQERKLLNQKQERKRKLKMMGIVCLQQFINGFNLMFYTH